MKERKIFPVCLPVPKTKFDDVDGKNVIFVGMGLEGKVLVNHLKQVNLTVSKIYNAMLWTQDRSWISLIFIFFIWSWSKLSTRIV